MTINDLALNGGIQPRSLQRRISRNKMGVFGLDEDLPPNVIKWVNDGSKPNKKAMSKQLVIQDKVVEKIIKVPVEVIREVEVEKIVEIEKVVEVIKEIEVEVERVIEVHVDKIVEVKRKFKIIEILPILPLPMLGLAASYGVYFFAIQFVPTIIAIAEAAAFELTYIGLASMENLSEKGQERARRVSMGAVGVSVVYNTLAGAIHQNECIFEDLHIVWFWVLALVHGAPLAILAFLVSDLIFHQKK